ncbi:MAG: hypothetical protein WKF43_02850 [Acidimicrobiales bacterium]
MKAWSVTPRRRSRGDDRCDVGVLEVDEGDESWAAGLPLSGRTAELAVQYLGTLLEAAIADGLAVSDPVRGAKRPRVDTQPVVPFTADEVDRLRDAAPSWFEVALTLGAGCGLRQGEAAGL